MNERILIIEDDQQILKLLQRGLAYEGYTIDTATDGRMGLILARDHTPDLVILDWMLPGMDGLEVCHRHAPYGSGGSPLRPPAFAAGNGYTLQEHYFRRRSHIPIHGQKLLHASVPAWDASGITPAVHIPWRSEKWSDYRVLPAASRYQA